MYTYVYTYICNYRESTIYVRVYSMQLKQNCHSYCHDFLDREIKCYWISYEANPVLERLIPYQILKTESDKINSQILHSVKHENADVKSQYMMKTLNAHKFPVRLKSDLTNLHCVWEPQVYLETQVTRQVCSPSVLSISVALALYMHLTLQMNFTSASTLLAKIFQEELYYLR